jgi:hypothetical protein
MDSPIWRCKDQVNYLYFNLTCEGLVKATSTIFKHNNFGEKVRGESRQKFINMIDVISAEHYSNLDEIPKQKILRKDPHAIFRK